jgi:hypothetical protein
MKTYNNGVELDDDAIFVKLDVEEDNCLKCRYRLKNDGVCVQTCDRFFPVVSGFWTWKLVSKN